MRCPALSPLLPSLVLALAIVSGCAGPGAERRGTLSARRDDAALVRAAGGQAAAVAVLRPGRWTDGINGRNALASLVSGARPGRDERQIASLLQAPSLWSAVSRIAHFTSAGEDALSWPAALAGWDEGRPLVLALGDSTEASMGAASLALLNDDRGAATGAAGASAAIGLLRHRLLVPARDVAVLHTALRDLCARLGLRPAAGPGEAFTRRGLLLGFFPEADHVRIEVVQGADIGEAGEALGAALALLRAPVLPATGALSPALRQILRGEDLLAVYVRPQQLRAVSIHQGIGAIRSALRGVDPSFYGILMAKGWAELSAGYLFINPEEAEILDVAYGLGADLRLWAVTTLSPRAQRAWRAAAQGGLPTAAPLSPGIASVQIGVALPQLLQQAMVPSSLRGLDAGRIANFMKECGWACQVYAGASTLGLLRAVADTASRKMNPLAFLPVGLSLSLLDLRDEKPPLAGGLALSYPAGTQLGLLRQLLSAALPSGFTLEDRALPGQTLFHLSLLRRPDELFAAPARLPPGVLMQAAVDLTRLRGAGGLNKRERADLDAHTASLAGLRLRVSLGEGVLSAELMTDLVGVPPAAFRAPPDALAQSPAGAGAGEAGRTCLRQAVAAMRKGFDAVAGIDPDLRPRILAEVRAEVDGPLSCAAREPGSRDEAALLRQFLNRVEGILTKQQ